MRQDSPAPEDTVRALPPALRAQLHEWGPRWHQDIRAGAQAMLQAWSPHIRSDPPAGALVLQDLPYGPHTRQCLDLVAPPGLRQAPVLVFVHGGAFVHGDRRLSPLVYGNVLHEFARAGFVAIHAGYRLAPQATWPAGAEDVRDAVLWVHRHVARWGGDPARVLLMGHSAGGAHCATACWDAGVRPPGGLPVAALALLSPRLDADQRPGNPNAPGVRAYYGDDSSAYARRAPLHTARPDAPPCFLAFAEYENPFLEFQALDAAHRLAQCCDTAGGRFPRIVQCAEHNHMSLVLQFDTGYNRLGQALRAWFGRATGHSPGPRWSPNGDGQRPHGGTPQRPA